MKTITRLVLIFSIGVILHAEAQQQQLSPLFRDEQPLNLEFTLPIREVKKTKPDSIFFDITLKYRMPGAPWDSIAAEVRARGNFRREKCYYPPLRMKIKRAAGEHTLFAGNKSLKIVLPCQQSKDANSLILREYLGYQLYEPMTPYFFNTRLATITLVERTGKQTKKHQLVGFLIEDDDVVAERFEGKIRETVVHPLQLADSTAITHDFFQYLISNTDWSTVAQHNVKVLQVKPNRNIPLAYDFDMSGLVNAPYAVVSPLTGQVNVRDRVYRSICRKEDLVEYVRQHYLKNESSIQEIITRHARYFSEKDLADIRSFIEEFFATLKSDQKFKEIFIEKCRKN